MWQRFEIASHADVAVPDANATAQQLRTVHMGTRTDEIVHAKNLVGAKSLPQRPGQNRTDKSTNARNQDAHKVTRK